jgi:hypothetical protein
MYADDPNAARRERSKEGEILWRKWNTSFLRNRQEKE